MLTSDCSKINLFFAFLLIKMIFNCCSDEILPSVLANLQKESFLLLSFEGNSIQVVIDPHEGKNLIIFKINSCHFAHLFFGPSMTITHLSQPNVDKVAENMTFFI